MISSDILKSLCDNDLVQKASREATERKRLPIHGLRQPPREELIAEARRWALALSVGQGACQATADPVCHEDRLVLTHPNGHRVRAWFPSGCVEYKNLHRAYTGTTDVACMEAATAIAEQFLGRFALWPIDGSDQLRPCDLSFVSSQGIHGAGDMASVIRNNAVLRCRRVFDEISWIGPGAFVTCMIEGGDVVGYERNWRPLIRTTEIVDLISLEEALQHDAQPYLHSALAESRCGLDFSVKQVEFGYYAADRWTTQHSLLPAYRIALSIRGDVGVAVSQIIPAHRDSRLAALLPAPDKRPCTSISTKQHI
ncbi:hypothetical protein WMF39_38185 [Sorangium sp. So ce1504]|uniref:hypothetical protein n=1 Tax=Sorangium sp. So ce1504 TaxID=3133337 RepID=UPI003F5EE4C8